MRIWTLLATAGVVLAGALTVTAQADPPDYQGRKYKATADLDGRYRPSLAASAVSYVNHVRKRERVRVICQAYGNHRIWDLVPNRDLVLFVPDGFIKTGTDGWAPEIRRCKKKDMKRVIEPDYSTDPFDP